MAAKYLTMVGQLQWLVTLGRFDIHAQVATMSRFRAAPRQGHMDRLKRIYSYANMMDIFLLLPSCGWCVTPFYFIFLFSFSFLFTFSGCGFEISFSFSLVASLRIMVILPLVISNLNIIGYTVGWSQCLDSISLKL